MPYVWIICTCVFRFGSGSMGTVEMRYGGGCGGSLTWNKEYLLKNCPSNSTSVNLKPIPKFCDDTKFRYPCCRFNTFCCVTKLLLHLVAEMCVYMWYDIPITKRCMEEIWVTPVSRFPALTERCDWARIGSMGTFISMLLNQNNLNRHISLISK